MVQHFVAHRAQTVASDFRLRARLNTVLMLKLVCEGLGRHSAEHKAWQGEMWVRAYLTVLAGPEQWKPKAMGRRRQQPPRISALRPTVRSLLALSHAPWITPTFIRLTTTHTVSSSGQTGSKCVIAFCGTIVVSTADEQANGPLTVDNVFDYFATSMFYDKQSNNQVLRMQTMHTGMPIANEAEELRSVSSPRSVGATSPCSVR